MRISSIVLLAIAAIVVNSAVVLSEQDPISKTNVIEPRLLKADKKVQTATRKLLRSQEAINFDEDESADDSSERTRPGASKLAELASKFSISQKVANKLWLKARQDPKNVFKMLNLHKAAEQLDETPQLLQWLEYVKAYRNKMRSDVAFADYQVYFKLLEVLPDDKVATLLQSLRRRPEFESLAKGVQISQYDKWFGLKRNSPEDIATMLGVKTGLSALSSTDPIFPILSEYAMRYVRNSVP